MHRDHPVGPTRSPSHRPGRSGVAALATLLLLALAADGGVRDARAAEIEDVEFPDAVEVGEDRLPLVGLGLLRYPAFFRGYVGALYLPRDAGREDVLADGPRAFELYYFWDIPGRFLGEKAEEHLKETLPAERLEALRPRLERLHSLFRDIAVGDRYRLVYRPGEGTTVLHNGEEIATILGADFARDYFGIWLGPRPLSDRFRDQILAGSADRGGAPDG